MPGGLRDIENALRAGQPDPWRLTGLSGLSTSLLVAVALVPGASWRRRGAPRPGPRSGQWPPAASFPREAPECLRDGVAQIQPTPAQVPTAGVPQRLCLPDGACDALSREKRLLKYDPDACTEVERRREGDCHRHRWAAQGDIGRHAVPRHLGEPRVASLQRQGRQILVLHLAARASAMFVSISSTRSPASCAKPSRMHSSRSTTRAPSAIALRVCGREHRASAGRRSANSHEAPRFPF